MDPRVKTVRAWADDESGSIDLDVLEAYLTCGSLRMAGQFLHMHHSSVASRLARVEEKLDLDLTMPAGLFHARLCLYAATLAANE
ncbi:MAG TPA: helix-turn-helix domain-containing protein [Microcella sp.]|nr:helix-turn-helix domain-containing protein [Microcella sp.]